MSRIWMPGGAGGADVDVVTAGPDDVLLGKVIVGPDGEPLTGVLALDGTAADSQVLAGKTYYNTDAKTKRTGGMPNIGAVSPPGLNAGESYIIPAGYHNGQGKVPANSLASQTDATAAAGNILKDKTAWVKGAKITGTMANYAGVPDHIDAARLQNNQYQVAVHAGYHGYSWAGNSYEYRTYAELASDIGLTAAKLAKNQTVIGVAGSYTSDANAAAADLLKDKTAYVNGAKVTGTMESMAGQTITPSASQQTVSCSGKKMTGNVVVKGDSNLVAANIISGKSIFNVAGSAKQLRSLSSNKVSSSEYLRIQYGSNANNTKLFYKLNIGAIDFDPLFIIAFGSGSINSTTWITSPQSNGLFNMNVISPNANGYFTYNNELQNFVNVLSVKKSNIVIPVELYNTTIYYTIIGY